MLAAVLAAALAAAAPVAPNIPTPTSGDWVLAHVSRVISPENMPGQCFVLAQVERVVRGTRYKPGQPLNLSLACRRGAGMAIALPREPALPPLTIQALKDTKRALIHLDATGQVVGNQFYNVGVQPLEVG